VYVRKTTKYLGQDSLSVGLQNTKKGCCILSSQYGTVHVDMVPVGANCPWSRTSEQSGPAAPRCVTRQASVSALRAREQKRT
jgi:hypothetical protein